MNTTADKQLVTIVLLTLLLLGIFIITPGISLGAIMESKVNFTAIFSDGFYWTQGISGSLTSVNPTSVAPSLKRAFIVTESTKFINTPNPTGDEPIVFKSVTVAGYYDERKYKVFVESISGQPVVPSQNITQPQNDVTNWKTYTDVQYNFEIKYPTLSYDIYKEANHVFIKKIDSQEIILGITPFSNPKGETLKEYLKENTKLLVGGSIDKYEELSKNEPIHLNDLEGIKYGTESDEYMIFAKDNFVIRLFIGLSNKALGEKILSTFKLIQSTIPNQLVGKTTGDKTEKISIGDLLLSLGLDWLITAIVVTMIIISAIWTHNDLKRLNVAGVNSFLSPVTWSTLVIILWPIFFPAYLILRFTEYKKRASLNQGN